MNLQTHTLEIQVPGRTLCTGLNLQIDPGQNWAILGANGSGKTTLLQTLAGLRPPASGTVALGGRGIASYPHRERARYLGLLLQDYGNAFPASVMETVLSGRHPYLSRWQWQDDIDDLRLAQQSLTAVGLDGFADRLVDRAESSTRRTGQPG